ncbi:MAG: TlpA family protein disulfide reductase [Bacteroidetes bacterium]|nr:MAG: TlpA family protein disulfide reductase [Bacteroidota bacterium]RLD71452.1 MAG: TlpA family protein disulfide reductase [Bacteroidota bacterium]RLD95247.1 MAG: TlpA family protein disulfide reductase [Bacteroidota bacterium]RLE05485.1 MAG: TlpA family protein disulfide reductase [Bacteroidota bacterium]
MASLKERFTKWKEKRSIWQKAGDILFWVLIILFLIPGPRKAIMTTMNRATLLVKAPRMIDEDKQKVLTDMDYNWTLAWAENEPFYFTNFREEVVFINFWATWCPPCVAEMSEIEELYKKYGHRVAFMLVTSEKPEVVNAFMEKNQYQIPVFYMAGIQAPEALSFNGYPTTFIISRDGHVVTKKTGAANWNSKATRKIFEELLN